MSACSGRRHDPPHPAFVEAYDQVLLNRRFTPDDVGDQNRSSAGDLSRCLLQKGLHRPHRRLPHRMLLFLPGEEEIGR